MNTWSAREQAAAIADLCGRAAAQARRLDAPGAGEAARCAANLRDNDETEARYREGLKWLQVPESAIDSAVLAIRDGRHPDDSLPGQVLEEYKNVQSSDGERPLRYVLELIGCEVPAKSTHTT